MIIEVRVMANLCGLGFHIPHEMGSRMTFNSGRDACIWAFASRGDAVLR